MLPYILTEAKFVDNRVWVTETDFMWSNPFFLITVIFLFYKYENN